MSLYKCEDEEQNNKINYDLSHRNILVVDDNPINQMITKRILENKNATVMQVDNGFDAIEIVKKTDFNIILMDIHMPKMNGYETTKKIRIFNKKTPILALTALKVDDNNNDIYDAGMDGVILKPFVLESFFKELNKYIK